MSTAYCLVLCELMFVCQCVCLWLMFFQLVCLVIVYCCAYILLYHFVRLLSRLALPICLNYLYMINVVQLSHRDDSVPTTVFTKVCGIL